MVIADRLKSDNSFRVSITPNRSISWRGNLIFVFLVLVFGYFLGFYFGMKLEKELERDRGPERKAPGKTARGIR